MKSFGEIMKKATEVNNYIFQLVGAEEKIKYRIKKN